MVFYNNSIFGLNLDLTRYWFDYTGNHKPTRHVKAPVIGVGFFFGCFGMRLSLVSMEFFQIHLRHFTV